MASKGVRLFKIATQINIGKDTIVEYLQSKGYDIENKATAVLNDEMLDIVLENFQKEHNAAQKQRQKTEDLKKHKQPTAKDETDPSALTDEDSDPEPSVPVSADSHESIEAQPQPPAEPKIDVPPVVESEPPADIPKPVAPVAKATADEEASIPVGTVISLDNISTGGTKRHKGKATPAKSESAPQEAPAPERKEEKKHVAPKPVVAEQAQPKPVAEQAPVQPVVKEQPKPIPPPLSVDAKDTNTPTELKEAKKEQAPVAESKEEEVKRTIAKEVEESIPADAEQSDIEILDGELDEEGNRKKRKKKKFGEIQYQTTGSPQLRGLTILGKIELVPRSKKNDKKKDPREEGKGKNVLRGKPTAKDQPNKLANKDARPGTQSAAAAAEAKKPLNKRKKKSKREKVSEVEVDRAIRRTLSGVDDSGVASRSKMRQKRRLEREEEQRKQSELRDAEAAILHVTEFITVGELANLLEVSANDIILACMQLGLMVSINQRLEKDTIELIASDFNVEVEFEEEFSVDAIEDEEDPEETLQARAPIVTIMGHVDHGKTSLLDHIRDTKVVAGEAGGITQHIGAYSVNIGENKHITFLDTPGHQAFTAMRARGAQVTDIVVLVVAADDSVMPQTIEAISHARAASVPIVVAINKMDKPDSNSDRIKQQLTDHDILVEDWGGKIQAVELSAKTGLNVDLLLEKILIEAELLNLRANPDRNARGTVVESKIDKGKGAVATIIVQKGILSVGDPFICGVISGRVRAMLDERGHRIEKAGPATPVQILGFDGVPQAGDHFIVMKSESESKSLAGKRQQIKREQEFKQIRHVTLDDISKNIQSGGIQDLRIILKADTNGSVEALADSLLKLSTDEVRIQVLHKAVGGISEGDIMLAAASEAIVIGFHVHPSPQAKRLAEQESVDVRLYKIIYDCINEIKLALEGMLRPELKEEVTGMAEVRQVFKISKLGTIAGCYMLEGKINRNDGIRIIRDGFEVFSGKIQSLKRLKDDVREVDTGFECGIAIQNFNDLKEGDIIEAVKVLEIKRTLQ